MIRITDKELCGLVCRKSDKYTEPYYYMQTDDGVCLVPFGDFVEVYSSFDEMIENA